MDRENGDSIKVEIDFEEFGKVAYISGFKDALEKMESNIGYLKKLVKEDMEYDTRLLEETIELIEKVAFAETEEMAVPSTDLFINKQKQEIAEAINEELSDQAGADKERMS